ncbi:MAG: 30S ribosomal protein S16 [Dehalococcoidia bacterium]|nr:30S ribosomal protein S16 [Dehalococcoidia bacterium]
MLKIHLSRVGKKKRPSYRIVVADSRAARDGANVEIIGHYDPLTDPPTIVINEERASHWLEQGAQPSEAVAKLLARKRASGQGEQEPILAAAESEGEGEPSAPETESQTGQESTAAEAESGDKP